MRETALALAIAAVAAAGCSGDGRTELGYRPVLRRIPEDALSRCRQKPLLEPACPRMVPRASTSKFYRVLTNSPRLTPEYGQVSIEWGVPYPGISARNRPPRFAHLVVAAGDLSGAFPFNWPDGSTGSTSEQDIERKRRHALLLGSPSWGDKEGELVLASSFPHGGINGDHLIFRWTENETSYAVTLHAWEPISETRATLEAVIASIP
jgi:hypothetical protein